MLKLADYSEGEEFLTWQSPACSSSYRLNYESRESDQQNVGLTDNKPSFTRKPHVVIFRQNPFAANVVPKLVSMATSLRPAISAMSSLDSLFSKTHPLELNSVSLAIIQLKLYPHWKQKSGCNANLRYLQGIDNICILHSNSLHNQSLSCYRQHKASYSNFSPKIGCMATSFTPRSRLCHHRIAWPDNWVRKSAKIGFFRPSNF